MCEALLAERGGFSQLEHTDPEAQEVSNYYGEDSRGGKAVVIKGVQAGEARLKHFGRAPRVLHLATDGFFLSRQADAEDVPTDTRVDRALSLSGLALAGANLGLQGKTGPDYPFSHDPEPHLVRHRRALVRIQESEGTGLVQR